MADLRYPVFVSGQTLTKDDLNVLRAFLDESDRSIGRAIGFGIACGLEGTIAGQALTIAPGIGIDQAGRVAILRAPVSFAVTSAGTAAFPFVDPAPGGVTPVLLLEDVEEPAPECDETGCDAHAATRLRRPRIVLATGRLRSVAAGFAAEALLNVSPLTVSKNSAVKGSFTTVRNTISSRLEANGVVLSTAGKDRLAGLALGTKDLPAVQIYKAAFLNQVLFAAIELLRCRALHASVCLRNEPQPGIALGWLHSVGGVPTWDCRWRHAFQPPAGLVTSLLGGACDDPCGLLLNRLEALLASYQEPAAPPKTDPPKQPPKGSDFHICDKKKRTRSNRNLLYGNVVDCLDLPVPPDHLTDDLWDSYKEWEDLPYPQWDGGFTDPVDPWILYAHEELDFAGAGAVTLNPAFGADAAGTKVVLEQVIQGQGLTSDVRVMSQAQATQLPGYSSQTTVSLGDTIVLDADGTGKVLTTGRIANQQALKSAGPTLAKATTDAETALARTETVGAAVTQVEQLSKTFDTQVGQLSTTLNQLQLQLADLDGRTLGIKRDVELAIGETRLTTQRVDQFVARASGVPEKYFERNVDNSTAMVDMVSAIRNALAASTTGAKQRAVFAELSKAEPQLQRLATEARSGRPLLAEERDSLITLIDNTIAAIGKTGVSREVVDGLRRDARNFKHRVR